MHIHAPAHKLTGIAANLLAPGLGKSDQTTEIIGKKKGDQVAPDHAAGLVGSDEIAQPQPGKNGRSAPIAGADETRAAKVRPEAQAHRRFGPKTLDALIEAQTALETAAQRVVESLDADGDGGFTLAELKDALPGKSGEAPGRSARAERLFGRIDSDGDGKVTLAELTALFAPRPVEPAEEESAASETAAADTTSEVIDPAKTIPSA